MAGKFFAATDKKAVGAFGLPLLLMSVLYIIYKSGLRNRGVWFTITGRKNFFEKNEKKCLTKKMGRGILSKFAAENIPVSGMHLVN